MAIKHGVNAHGELRLSQLVGAFGPGAMLDLPRHSVIVAGLEHWLGLGEPITETRLVAKIKAMLDITELDLFGAPVDPEGNQSKGPATGVRCFEFPEWFVTQDELGETVEGRRSQALIPIAALTKGKFIDRDGKKQSVVPIRFVRACRKGHIGDIDWYALVHGDGKTECRSKGRMLFMDERGATGDLSEVWVRCQCGAMTDLLSATRPNQKILGHCDGARPWLGLGAREQCKELNRFLVRNASNAYFAHKLSVISLPERDEEIKQAVDAIWDFVSTVSGPEHMNFVRGIPKVAKALETITEQELLEEIHRRKTAVAAEQRPVKEAELQSLMAVKEEIGEDRPHGFFYARALPESVWGGPSRPWMAPIERVVLVHRLREVTAQIGFTRFEPPSARTDGDLDLGVEMAAMAREAKWLPAVENRGEGIFLQFRKEAVAQWVNRLEVVNRLETLKKGFDLWKAEHPKSKREFPGGAYHLLHSFSHMLITSVSLECGYPSSSIRERIYDFKDQGYGVLLFTGTSDAEGTLGGLVEVGRRIHEHVKSALESGRLCSNDPVCAEHDPGNPHATRYLQAAACHGCLLISETCCEQFNDFLDRALVVQTVGNTGLEFFTEGLVG